MLYEQWVVPCTYKGKDIPPGPTPEEAGLTQEAAGFEEPHAYLVVATVEDCDENGEIWYNVINQQGQTWSLSNRHFRTVQIGVIGASEIRSWITPIHNVETTQEVLEHIECLGD